LWDFPLVNYITAKSSVAGQITAQTELERENMALKARVAELERLVVCDTLTPAFNRRHFMDELGQWCWRNHALEGEDGLLYVDVDNLKSVNDTLGHAVGDMLLIAVAEALLAAVRRSDIVARVGGDEFAILLSHIPAEKLREKAESITNAVGKLEIPYQGGRLTPQVSIGFTAIEAGIPPEDLLLRADRSMYAAKQANRSGQLN
jgi:diguanylate cyclase (GGDEF)-like protein